MQSSKLFSRLSEASSSNCLRPTFFHSHYRCLHSSQRLREGKSRRSEDLEASNSSQSSNNHPVRQSQLTVRHAKAIEKYEAKPTKQLKRFSKEELVALKEKYTPAQMAAVMAGEESISLQDVADQGILHQGPMTLDYLDDFSQHRPTVDKHPELPGVRDPKTGKMPRFRWKNDSEIADDLEDWLDAQPYEGGSEVNWNTFVKEYKPYDSAVDLGNARTAIAPKLFPIDDPILKAQARASQSQAEDDDLQVEYELLRKQTGFTMAQIESFRVKMLVTRFVTNQTRLGKRHQIYYMTIAGNGNGMLGIGEASAQIASEAKRKAFLAAIRNIVPISRYENRTIYGNVKGKSGATELELYTRHPGFGSRGQSLIFEICKMVGIKDISARVTRSRNPMNIVKATFNALRSQQDPEEVALGRGRRMVDLRKVYYGGKNA